MRQVNDRWSRGVRDPEYMLPLLLFQEEASQPPSPFPQAILDLAMLLPVLRD